MLNNDQITIIWNEYKEQNEWKRHNENQRAQLSSFLLAISGALLVFLSKDLKRSDWPIAIFLVGIGVLGILAILKYRERFMLHVQLERALRKVLDSYFTSDDNLCGQQGQDSAQENLFIKTLKEALEEHKKGRFPLLKERYFRQHWLWIAVFTLITLLGAILLIKINALSR